MEDHSLVRFAANAALEALIEKAEMFVARSHSDATRRSYASDIRDFERFCTERGLPFLPASEQIVVLYVTHLAAEAGAKFSTISRRLAAITELHRRHGYAAPSTLRDHALLRDVLRGIGRTLGTTQHQKHALTTDELRVLLAACATGLRGIRDRALLLTGFAGAFRREELARIEIAWLSFEPRGCVIALPISKENQEEGRAVPIAYGEHEGTCPVRALERYLAALRCRGIAEGALFRGINRGDRVSGSALNARSVAKVLAKVTNAAGLGGSDISPHSLRAGFCTTAAVVGGATEAEIVRVSGHRSTVVRCYIRPESAFEASAAGKVGL
jgi:site-specific recombinase XerD